MTIEALKMIAPYSEGVWNKENLIEFLIWHCNIRFSAWIRGYFADFTDDMELADLLFDIVLDDDYEGSDARMSAAYFISKLSEDVLKEKKDLLIQTQQNEVLACRPLSYIETTYEWLRI
ncbi:hypothetical protein V3C10_07320 [[Clostridium] symbiosum]|uniref:hypothetical protein n=1 Tax=Clostridium symbiosum TaxID=1512 RepID=UPI001D076774|nr:hypothetical protein [[Clostridium] symbiosum]MCB6607183.1 hypothetical protein [[Clostridium] symbiosum]MCB6929743.1 hypothetical protein [[Clostridium] symbiosum]